jgi:hypothetical protein
MSATTQPQTSPQTSTAWPKEDSSGDMQARLEKAMKRTEQLGYAIAGVGVIILVVVIVFYIIL